MGGGLARAYRHGSAGCLREPLHERRTHLVHPARCQCLWHARYRTRGEPGHRREQHRRTGRGLVEPAGSGRRCRHRPRRVLRDQQRRWPNLEPGHCRQLHGSDRHPFARHRATRGLGRRRHGGCRVAIRFQPRRHRRLRHGYLRRHLHRRRRVLWQRRAGEQQLLPPRRHGPRPGLRRQPRGRGLAGGGRRPRPLLRVFGRRRRHLVRGIPGQPQRLR